MAGKKISQLTSGSLSNLPLSGVTPVVYSGTTIQHSLSDLRNKLVDSGSHHFTGSQYIKGNLEISGSITAHEYILSSSITNIEIQNVSGSSIFGNTLDDTHQFTGSILVTGSVRSTSMVAKEFLFVSGFAVIGDPIHHSGSDPEALHVGTTDSYNIAHFKGDNEYYSQVYITNTNSGSNASTDLVIVADNGTETVHFVDLGINSSTYTGGLVGYENDSYLLNVGKDLYIGTVGGTEHPAKLKLFAENSWENPQITIHTGSQVTFNTSSFTEGYTYEFSGSLKLHNELSVNGSVTASYFIGDGSQLTNLPGLTTLDRLTKNELEVVLDYTGSLNTPLILPRSFTVNLTEQYYTGNNSLALSDEPWSLNVSYVVSENGIVETQVDNIFPILSNPGYVSGDSFEFGYSVHGISGYTLTIQLNDVVLPGGAGWTSNLAFSQPPSYPATIKSLGAIKLTANNENLIFGTNGNLEIPGNTYVNGLLDIKGVSENIVVDGEFNGDRDFDFTYGSIFHLSSLGGNGIWNINNVPTTDNKAITITFVIEQGLTPFSGSAYQINGESIVINWIDSVIPTGSANKTEIIGLTAFRTHSSWNVLGALSTFGS